MVLNCENIVKSNEVLETAEQGGGRGRQCSIGTAPLIVEESEDEQKKVNHQPLCVEIGLHKNL